MKKILRLLPVLILVNTLASAQSKLPSNFFMKKLPNGLELLVIEDKTVPLATIEIVVKNGSYTEDSAFNGLSHMYEHMFFKANKDLPSQEAFLKRIQELGVVFNGTTALNSIQFMRSISRVETKSFSPCASVVNDMVIITKMIRTIFFMRIIS